ncbi:protein of unknown function [Enterobacter cancerogenus]|nr:protein of unknown function [Enterobacter cancerogenus]
MLHQRSRPEITVAQCVKLEKMSGWITFYFIRNWIEPRKPAFWSCGLFSFRALFLSNVLP